MIIGSKVLLIGIVIASIACGLLFYYLCIDSSSVGRQKINEAISQLINFVLFIWLGKVVTNFSIFMEDPLAILAYPSDSKALYAAVLFMIIFLFIKGKRQQLQLFSLFETIMYVLLAAALCYEFIQYVFMKHSLSIYYIMLFGVLLLLAVFFNKRFSLENKIAVILALWAIGMSCFSYLLPYVTIFGFIVEWWAIALFAIVCIIFLKRGNVT